jgi:4-hydroxy-3-polyprenylbenzoate decarboxylase
MGIDATRKWPTEGFTRPWPDEIVMDAHTKALVDNKWKALAKELGIDLACVENGLSSRLAFVRIS